MTAERAICVLLAAIKCVETGATNTAVREHHISSVADFQVHSFESQQKYHATHSLSYIQLAPGGGGSIAREELRSARRFSIPGRAKPK
jgi:hypothetical protein